MKAAKRLALALAGLLLLSLSGCGYPELYERVLIHGMGVDWTGEGYRVTVRSSVSPEDEGEELFVCEGPTVLEALSSLSLSTGRQPFYAHNYLVVFGMGCARRGLDDCLDFFVRYYNTRPAVKLFLAEGQAEEVLSSEKDGKLMKMSQLQALGGSGKTNGQAVDADILSFVNGIKGEGSSPVLPVLSPTEEGAQITGTAYFQGYQVKGLLGLEQTRGYLAATGGLDRGELTVSGEAFGTVTLSLRGVKGTIRPRLDGRPAFQLTVEAEADVSAAAGPRQDPAAFYPALEEATAQLLSQEIRSALFQTAERDSCDIFGLGGLLYRRYSSYWRQNRENWPALMPQCGYEVQVAVKVRRLEQEDLQGIS